ncbi:UDP-N-acetyl-D-mannosaminuronic acid dehydrogenase [Amycolatopsis marina]|uniref:UDP-N-acetyl-D-mannosaminuronic acid dehydrogenase n=1 Tax=Amycolatopsis marina TaxID=490629 RepID=A0A1I0ZKS1_9PSEU|nr:nucleotide sugar dehydrogenase [Amycolatopsis marina]SFB25962.1 UDP-N-acetyl-D-mannosaminuronic acid dehydrogenase [Amycolatopsis marina]
MRWLPTEDEPRVALIGLGYVGLCLAATLSQRGLNVVGVDTNRRLVDELTAGDCPFVEPGLASLLLAGMAADRLSVTTDYSAVRSADVVLITVGTPVNDDGSLSEEQLHGACAELSKHIRRGQLLVLKSTVPPGTTGSLVLRLLERSGLTAGADFGLAVSPERLAEGTALHELKTLPMVVGGFDADSARDAAEFWRRALGVEVIEVGSLTAAEIVKLASNWWIDHNIALANELAKFCALYGVDSLDVIAAANTIPKGGGNVNILLPSVGVGGSCLTKDPWMVWHSARERGLDIVTAPTGRGVNESMPEYTAQLAFDQLTKLGKDPAASKVAVIGLTFKNNTGDLRATPTEHAVAALRRGCAEVALFDPLVDRDEAERLFAAPLATSVDEAVQDADCVAVFALHRELAGIDFGALPVADGCLILDGRAYYSPDQIASLRALGYHYCGVGR